MPPRDIQWYLEKAKEKQGVPSNAKLAYLIGITPPSLAGWNRGYTLPAPEKMVKLAELARVPAEVALADLGSWHAEKDGPAAAAYQAMIKAMEKATRFGKTAALWGALAFGGIHIDGDGNASASAPEKPVNVVETGRQHNAHSIYIMGNFKRHCVIAEF